MRRSARRVAPSRQRPAAGTRPRRARTGSAREHRQIFNETFASLALARVLLGSAGLAAAPEIEAALDRAFELVRQTGAKAIEPHVHVELAALARLRGDRGGEQRELRRAHQLFAKIGATGHARRLAVELAVAAW